MKKILASLLVCAGLLTSCDMDLNPVGTLNGEDGIASMADAANYRNSIYTGIRGFSSSAFFTDVEIQMDMFQATNMVGNRGILYASGSVLPSSGEISEYYLGIYTRIATVNYFIEKCQPLLDAAKTAEDEEAVQAYERYLGEAHFARAYYYWALLDRFSPEINAANMDKEHLGFAIVDTYNPTSDRSKYPARSSQRESLKFINDDLDYALTAILDYEKVDDSNLGPNSPYINSATVKALQARVALISQDYATAVTKATEVIESGNFALTQPRNYNDLWLNDTGDELIFVPYESSPSEISNAIGSRWLSFYDTQADYIPSYEALAMYYDDDCRFDSYYDVRGLIFEGTQVPAYAFYKFPGNPALKVSTATNLVNKPKPFRLSELYLIAAEAASLKSDDTTAQKYYNAFCKQRHTGWVDVTYTGSALLEEIRYERTCELIGEGFRMSDLRRWHQGFTRNPEHPENPTITSYLWASTAYVSYQPDDYKYTWPIPQAELEVNPQMKGQQNPGY